MFNIIKQKADKHTISDPKDIFMFTEARNTSNKTVISLMSFLKMIKKTKSTE